jgi:hypothetical protein
LFLIATLNWDTSLPAGGGAVPISLLQEQNMITVKSFLGFGNGWIEQPFDSIEDAIEAFNSMDPCRDLPRIYRDGITVVEHDVESGMAVMIWADDVKMAYNSVTNAAVVTKGMFEALMAEEASLLLEDAKGQDTPEGDRRLLQIKARMEASPWVFDMDEGVIPK